MKRSDLCPNRFGDQLTKVIEQASSSDVSRLGTSDANQMVGQISAAIEALTTLRSRTALQAARSQHGGQDIPARERYVRNIFDTGDLTRSEVKHEAIKAKVIDQLPKLEEHLHKITSSNLGLVAKQVGRLNAEQISRLDQGLIVNKAQTLAPDKFEVALSRHVSQTTQTLLEGSKAKRAASKVKHWLDGTTGMGHVHAELDPERYERIANKIDREVARLANLKKKESGSTSNASKDAHLAADAFCNLMSSQSSSLRGTGNSNSCSSSNSRPLPAADILVVVDIDTLKSGRHSNTIAETEAGTPLADETISQLACDATVRKIETDNSGLALNVGRKSRTATDAQWNAAKSMYPTCAWHGCTTRIQHTQLHHIQYWRHGGKTDMSNLVPLCHHHHDRVHAGGWSLKLKPDRSLEHYKPDKSLWKTTKPPNRLNSG